MHAPWTEERSEMQGPWTEEEWIILKHLVSGVWTEEERCDRIAQCSGEEHMEHIILKTCGFGSLGAWTDEE